MPHNIDKSPFRPGTYIGYTAIGRFRITQYMTHRGSGMYWRAENCERSDWRTIYADTLSELSVKLEAVQP